MFCVTSSYRRKDGTKARQYVCRGRKFADGTCRAYFDGEVVDQAVMERLHDLLPDFEAWIAQIEDRHASERARIVELVEKAEHDLAAQEDAAAKHERLYRKGVADDNPKLNLLLEFVEEARQEVRAAETRLQAARDALASIPVEAPRDRLLDFAIDLRNAIRGKTGNARSVEEVNRVLVETFTEFSMAPGAWGDPAAMHVKGITSQPSIRVEVAAALLQNRLTDAGYWQADPDRDWPAPGLEFDEALASLPADPAPPIAWIRAVRNSDGSQEPDPAGRPSRLFA